MELTLKIEQTYDLKTIVVMAGVRYWEDGEVNGVEDVEGTLIPCRHGDLWRPFIEIETGRINNWKHGTKAKVHYKVCDQCGFQLYDVNDKVIYEQEDGYVPKVLCPKGSGYGDYIIMDIDENGIIANWNPSDLLKEFED